MKSIQFFLSADFFAVRKLSEYILLYALDGSLSNGGSGDYEFCIFSCRYNSFAFSTTTVYMSPMTVFLVCVLCVLHG